MGASPATRGHRNRRTPGPAGAARADGPRECPRGPSLAGPEGFTLIELLITIVIVGILAAIAVPQYRETSRRAHEAAAKEDLRNLMTAQEMFRHRNDAYSDGTQASAGAPVTDENGEVLVRTSPGVTLSVTGGDGGFTAVAGHPRAEQWWCVNTVDGSGRIESVAPNGSC